MVAEGGGVDFVQGKKRDAKMAVCAAEKVVKDLNARFGLEEGQDRGGVKNVGPDFPAPGPGGAAPAGQLPKDLRAWQCLSVARTDSPGWDRPQYGHPPPPSRVWSFR